MLKLNKSWKSGPKSLFLAVVQFKVAQDAGGVERGTLYIFINREFTWRVRLHRRLNCPPQFIYFGLDIQSAGWREIAVWNRKLVDSADRSWMKDALRPARYSAKNANVRGWLQGYAEPKFRPRNQAWCARSYLLCLFLSLLSHTHARKFNDRNVPSETWSACASVCDLAQCDDWRPHKTWLQFRSSTDVFNVKRTCSFIYFFHHIS